MVSGCRSWGGGICGGLESIEAAAEEEEDKERSIGSKRGHLVVIRKNIEALDARGLLYILWVMVNCMI